MKISYSHRQYKRLLKACCYYTRATHYLGLSIAELRRLITEHPTLKWYGLPIHVEQDAFFQNTEITIQGLSTRMHGQTSVTNHEVLNIYKRLSDSQFKGLLVSTISKCNKYIDIKKHTLCSLAHIFPDFDVERFMRLIIILIENYKLNYLYPESKPQYLLKYSNILDKYFANDGVQEVFKFLYGDFERYLSLHLDPFESLNRINEIYRIS